MSMTQRGHTNLGGNRAAINPFMDNGVFGRVMIEVDNSYNRGYIPPFSLWAPSDYGTSPKYMPYIPAIPIAAADESTYYDIPNEWIDYFKGADEVIALDINELASSDNLKFFGQQGAANDTDLAAVTLGTHSSTVSSIGAKDSGGTGYVRITMTDLLDTDTKPAEGALGTGDILVLAGHSSTGIKAYQQAQRVVIMEQAFNFKDPVDGLAAGNGGILVESAVYSYTGRIDYNYVEYYTYLNTVDASPALTVCTQFTNGTRFNFENIYRG